MEKKDGREEAGENGSQGTWKLPRVLCQHLPANPVYISSSFLLKHGEEFL